MKPTIPVVKGESEDVVPSLMNVKEGLLAHHFQYLHRPAAKLQRRESRSWCLGCVLLWDKTFPRQKLQLLAPSVPFMTWLGSRLEGTYLPYHLMVGLTVLTKLCKHRCIPIWCKTEQLTIRSW